MTKQKSAAPVRAAAEPEIKESPAPVSASDITEINTPAANSGKRKDS